MVAIVLAVIVICIEETSLLVVFIHRLIRQGGHFAVLVLVFVISRIDVSAESSKPPWLEGKCRSIPACSESWQIC